MQRIAPSIAVLLCASLALGCYSSTSVSTRDLATLHRGGRDGSAIVRSEEGDAVRLDPNSEIRFVRTDGTRTPWLTVRDLYVSDDGVFTVRDVDRDDLHAATVADLSDADVQAIYDAAPASSSIHASAKGTLLLRDDGRSLVPWMTAIAAARGHVPGSWTFHVSPDAGPYSGDALDDVMHHGLRLYDGLRWDHVAHAEVSNLNHGETAVAVVAVTALAVGLVTVVVLSKGKIPVPNISVPAKVVARATVDTTRATLDVASRANLRIDVPSSSATPAAPPPETSAPAASEDPAAAPPSPAPSTTPPPTTTSGGETATLGAPGDELPDPHDARPLFDGAARRQSIMKVVASMDVERELSTSRVHGAVAGAMRFYNFLEIGAGLRYLGPLATGDSTHSDLIPFARFGIHAELDARRRFSFPFAIDLGTGGDVGVFVKLVWGLRVRLTEQWSLGLYALNPTLVHYKANAGAPDVPQWSFPSGIETSFVF